MRTAKGCFAKQRGGKGLFAECEVTIEYPATSSDIVIDCKGHFCFSQGHVESVSANGYDDWKIGAKKGIEFALSIAQTINGHTVITKIEGLSIDTNPTVVGVAAAFAVWKALDFIPSSKLIEQLEEQVFNSQKDPCDRIPNYERGFSSNCQD